MPRRGSSEQFSGPLHESNLNEPNPPPTSLPPLRVSACLLAPTHASPAATALVRSLTLKPKQFFMEQSKRLTRLPVPLPAASSASLTRSIISRAVSSVTTWSHAPPVPPR